jgi:hypothetical protein
MAVQLARLSLWLATLAGDRPLSFLDHHLATGDSLLGAWLACLRQAPHSHKRTSPVDLPLFGESALQDALRLALPVRFTLASEPNDTIEGVRAKERALATLTGRHSAISKWKRVADLWCSRWFSNNPLSPAVFGSLSDAILSGRTALPGPIASRLLEEAETVAGTWKFFHWELEFPEAFFNADGTRQSSPGFDAIIGNPPWDMIRADTGSTDRRARARDDAKAFVRFVRRAGVYSAHSEGHCNRYHLFVERAIALTRTHGRIGLVLPSGLATDHGSARLRGTLFSRCAVDGFVGFDNTKGVFPVHRSLRFLLVTATAGRPTAEFGCRLGEVDAAVLDTDEAGDDMPARSWYPIYVTPSLLERLTGSEHAVPDFRSPHDLRIAERAASLFRPLGSPDGWAARFGRELNATEDRGYFHTAGSGVPVVEGKHIEPFRVDLTRTRWSMARKDLRGRFGDTFDHPRLAYRDVAGATNRTTFIAAILPAGCISTHTVFCLRTPQPLRAQYFLCGLFNSFVANYLVRLRVTTHVTTRIVEALPVPHPDEIPHLFEEIAGIARLLARRPHRTAHARLNACIARMYELSRDEFAHILSTFPLVPIGERDAALKEFSNRATVYSLGRGRDR